MSTKKEKQRAPALKLVVSAKVQPKPKLEVQRSSYIDEYLQHFQGPLVTPPNFHVFDMTDGGSIGTTSHT